LSEDDVPEPQSEAVLLTQCRDGYAIVTLNRPTAMNALSRELRVAIGELFRKLNDDPDVNVVILTGAGRAFCAGLDLKELETGHSREDGPSSLEMIRAVLEFEGPVIGAINGHAITGGFELALCCDFMIASSEARFADTHARVGIMPGWGLSQRLSRIIGIGRAKELSLTGNYLKADQAEAWGLVNRVVAPDALLPACEALAVDILSCEPTTMRSYKKVINDGYAASFGDGLAIETKANRSHRLDGDDFAQRRMKVQARGRNQTQS
jgi:enoyl-CoA hydratase